MKKVIVTGANGFVGSNLVNKLANSGTFVYAVVRNETSDLSRITENSNIKVVYNDFIADDKFRDIFRDVNDIDALYYLAWAGTSGNLRADYNLQLANIKAVCDSVNVAKELNIKKFIYAGSIMEHECMKYIHKDDSKPGLGSIYSIAKLGAHFMGKTLASNIGIDFVTLIISNIYGPGEFSARLINTSILKMLNGETCDFTEGKQLYDFIYIDDAISALQLVGCSGKAGHEYYIGNKNQRELKEFLIEMRDLLNPNVKLNLGKIPFSGPFLNYTEFNTQLLYDEFDFKPEVSFEEGILKTAKWLKKRS